MFLFVLFALRATDDYRYHTGKKLKLLSLLVRTEPEPGEVLLIQNTNLFWVQAAPNLRWSSADRTEPVPQQLPQDVSGFRTLFMCGWFRSV